jgi:hypothetical protein
LDTIKESTMILTKLINRGASRRAAIHEIQDVLLAFVPVTAGVWAPDSRITLSGAASHAIDVSESKVQRVITNQATTINLPASVEGDSYTIEVEYGGNHALTWAGGGILRWGGGSKPLETKVAGKMDIYVFTCDGTNTFGADGGRNY